VNNFVFIFHRHLTRGSHSSELTVVVVVLLTVVLLRTVVSKGEYTYGWYSASEGKCKATKDRLRSAHGRPVAAAGGRAAAKMPKTGRARRRAAVVSPETLKNELQGTNFDGVCSYT
jgi:hypothetical protein